MLLFWFYDYLYIPFDLDSTYNYKYNNYLTLEMQFLCRFLVLGVDLRTDVVHLLLIQSILSIQLTLTTTMIFGTLVHYLEQMLFIFW